MKITRRIITMALALMLSIGAFSLTASAAGTTMYGIGFVNASSLRLRSEPDANASTICMAPRNDCVVVISKSGQWYRVNYNLQEGYMHEDYLSVLTRENAELGYGSIAGSNVNMRSGPSTSSAVAAVTANGDRCYIIGLNNGWYKVIYGGKIGYIRSDFVDLTEIPYENQASPNSPKFYRHGTSTGVAPSAAALNGEVSSSAANSTASGGSATSSSPSAAPTEGVSGASGSEILAEAQKYLGTPYVNGGASPSGFDCSGFVYYVLKQVGYSPYRTPADQYKQGSTVEKDDLQPGDIVFFANTYTSGLSHVGIYAGGGQFIHSPNSRSTVSYSDLTSGYWAQHYYGARRMG